MPDPIAAPRHTDLMVTPESLDAYLEENSPNNLLPCPFCGGRDIDFTSERRAISTLFFGFCVSCGAQGPGRLLKSDAVKRWNLRADKLEDQDP